MSKNVMDELDELESLAEPTVIDDRKEATAWANEVLSKHSCVRVPDQPYVKAVLTELALIETPIKLLICGINDNDDHYRITIRGYKGLVSIPNWATIFHGKNRDDNLANITHSYFQLPETGPVILVIQMTKVNMHVASGGPDRSFQREGASSVRSYKKRY